MTATLPGLPLSGVRVVEFTHMIMGPACGLILGDLGADVIKVEPPGGDKTRKLPGLGSGFFRSFNRNKRSVVLDLDSVEGLSAALQLIASSDVMLENFRPGQMAKLGLDYPTLTQRFPRLIYVSHKGFLPGPYENRTALDEVVQMMAGLSYMTGPVGRPLRAGASVNDIMGGMFGAIGVLAALRERDVSGRGQEIQSALYENCVFLVSQHIQQFLVSGEPAPPMPARVSAWSVYDIFNLQHGEQLFIAATSDKQFRTLCGVLGLAELATDPRFSTNEQRVAQRPQLLALLGATLALWSKEALAARLDAAGLPYAPVMRPDQLIDDPHLKASGGLASMRTESGSNTQTVLLPLLLGGRRLGVRKPVPSVGEHTAEVMAELRAESGAVDCGSAKI